MLALLLLPLSPFPSLARTELALLLLPLPVFPAPTAYTGASVVKGILPSPFPEVKEQHNVTVNNADTACFLCSALEFR